MVEGILADAFLQWKDYRMPESKDFAAMENYGMSKIGIDFKPLAERDRRSYLFYLQILWCQAFCILVYSHLSNLSANIPGKKGAKVRNR